MIYGEDKNNDEGMFGRDVMKMLKEIGVCEEKDYPYGKIENKDNIICYNPNKSSAFMKKIIESNQEFKFVPLLSGTE